MNIALKIEINTADGVIFDEVAVFDEKIRCF